MVEKSVLLMAFALFLSLGVERMMEIVRAWERFREAKDPTSTKKWETRAASIRRKLEPQINRMDPNNPSITGALLSKYFVFGSDGANACVAISATEVRNTWVSARYKLISVTLGVLVATAFQLNVFEIVQTVGESSAPSDWITPLLSYLPSISWLGIPATGIAIGLGSEPLHKLISALHAARQVKRGKTT